MQTRRGTVRTTGAELVAGASASSAVTGDCYSLGPSRSVTILGPSRECYTPASSSSTPGCLLLLRSDTKMELGTRRDCPCEVCLLLCCASVPAYKVNTKAQVLKNSHILCERQFERFFGHRLRIEHFSLKGKPHKGPENDFSPLMR